MLLIQVETKRESYIALGMLSYYKIRICYSHLSLIFLLDYTSSIKAEAPQHLVEKPIHTQ